MTKRSFGTRRKHRNYRKKTLRNKKIRGGDKDNWPLYKKASLENGPTISSNTESSDEESSSNNDSSSDNESTSDDSSSNNDSSDNESSDEESSENFPPGFESGLWKRNEYIYWQTGPAREETQNFATALDLSTMSVDIRTFKIICEKFPNLESLNISNANISTLTGCSNGLKKLRELVIKNTRIPYTDVHKFFSKPYWNEKEVTIEMDLPPNVENIPNFYNMFPKGFTINGVLNVISRRGRQNAGRKRRTNKRKRSTKKRTRRR